MQLSEAPQQLQLAFGADAGPSYINTIPVPSQIPTHPGAASYTDGFPPLTMTDVTAGGLPIAGPDMNGILNAISAIAVWMSAGAGFPYNSSFSTAIGGYPKGARVLMASGNGYWVSTVDNNTSDPDTGGANWASADENAITALTGDVTAAGPGSAAATLATSGVTAGSYTNANVTVDGKGRVTAASNGSISATQNVVTGSRALYGVADPDTTPPVSGYIYQNTSGSALLVTVSADLGGGGFHGDVYTDSNSSPTTLVAEFGRVNDGSSPPNYYPAAVTFVVPAGNYYGISVTNGSGTVILLTWTEWTLG